MMADILLQGLTRVGSQGMGLGEDEEGDEAGKGYSLERICSPRDLRRRIYSNAWTRHWL